MLNFNFTLIKEDNLIGSSLSNLALINNNNPVVEWLGYWPSKQGFGSLIIVGTFTVPASE